MKRKNFQMSKKVFLNTLQGSLENYELQSQRNKGRGQKIKVMIKKYNL